MRSITHAVRFYTEHYYHKHAALNPKINSSSSSSSITKCEGFHLNEAQQARESLVKTINCDNSIDHIKQKQQTSIIETESIDMTSVEETAATQHNDCNDTNNLHSSAARTKTATEGCSSLLQERQNHNQSRNSSNDIDIDTNDNNSENYDSDDENKECSISINSNNTKHKIEKQKKTFHAASQTLPFAACASLPAMSSESDLSIGAAAMYELPQNYNNHETLKSNEVTINTTKGKNENKS